MKHKSRSLCALKQIWNSLFNENNFTMDDTDDDLQDIAMEYSKMKSSYEKVLLDLEVKNLRISVLSDELQRRTCEKCSILEEELINAKRKTKEAQNRMDSIANILKLGEAVDETQGDRKTSAITLVSQMLLGPDSPKRKKICRNPSPVKGQNSKTSPLVETPAAVSETVGQSCLSPEGSCTPVKKTEKLEIITSPGDLKEGSCLGIKLPSIRKSPRSVKKNLSGDFQKSGNTSQNTSSPNVSSKGKSPLNLNLDLDKSCQSSDLNGSLLDYVRDANSVLDKIWFAREKDKENSPKQEKVVVNEDITLLPEMVSGGGTTVVEETPEHRVKKKLGGGWKLKESRGLHESKGGKRLKQLTLGVQMKKSDPVDLSTLDGYDGGSVSSRDGATSALRNTKDDCENEMNFDVLTMSVFKPEATSTQILSKGVSKTGDMTSSKPGTSSPKYKYKRDAVRKKAERAKLPGWDCDQCAKYYGALGEDLSPSKIKSRMNTCSRHRDKFDQHNMTPAGYWNPLCPDTDECREQGLYVSVQEVRSKNK